MSEPRRIQRKRTKEFDRKAWLKTSSRPKAACHPERVHRARGMCDACYDRWLYANSPKNRATKLRNAKNWKSANSQKVKTLARNSKLKHKYGITTADYDRMFAAQYGQCGICKRSGIPLHVDHNHDSGAVRELLCLRCNGSLSWVEAFLTNQTFVIAALRYMEKHAKKNTTPKS